jgi:transposase-like protein
LTKPRPAEFKWRQFEPQAILMPVGWYLRFSLSYRDVEELVREPRLKPINKSWRVDETYIPPETRPATVHSL